MANKASEIIRSLPRTPQGVPIDLIPPQYYNGQGIVNKAEAIRWLRGYSWLYEPHKNGNLREGMKYAVFIEKWSLRVKVNYIGWSSSYLGRNILKYYYQDLARIEFLYPKDIPPDYEVVKIVPGNLSGASHSVLGKFYPPRGLLQRTSKYLLSSKNFLTYATRQVQDALDLYSNSGIEFKDLHQAYEVILLRNVLLFTTFAKKGTTMSPSEFTKAFDLLMELREKYFKYLYNGTESTTEKA